MHAVPEVHFGHLAFQLFLVSFHEASAHHQEAFFATTVFDFTLFENHVDGLFLGVTNKATGVDDDDVAVVLLAVEIDGLPARLQLSCDKFRIDGVFGAA